MVYVPARVSELSSFSFIVVVGRRDWVRGVCVQFSLCRGLLFSLFSQLCFLLVSVFISRHRLLGVVEVRDGFPRAVILVESLPLDLVLHGAILERALAHHLLHLVLLGGLLLGLLLGLPRVGGVMVIL